MREYKEIPIEDLLEPQTPVRLNAEDDEIKELAESINTIGLLEPLVVRPEGSKYRVVCGHRRLLACKLIGMDKIPCIITDKTEDEDLDQMLAENISRKDMSPIEEGWFFKEAIESKGYSINRLSRILGKSPSYIKTRIELLQYPSDVQQALHYGKISIGVAKWIAQITDDEIRRNYLEDAIKRQISVETARNWYHIWAEYTNQDKLGTPDPRVLAATPSEEHLYTHCQLCGEKKLYNQVNSFILCRGCQGLIRLFWEEYKKSAGDNSIRSGDIHSGNPVEDGE